MSNNFDSVINDLPTDWKIYGDLPPDVVPSSASDDEMAMLTEDLLQIRTLNDVYVIDIGWTPEASRDGHYVCQIIHKRDWAKPLEILETTFRNAVIIWLKNAIQFYKTNIWTHEDENRFRSRPTEDLSFLNSDDNLRPV